MKPSIDTKGGEKLMSRLGVGDVLTSRCGPDMDPLALVRADIAKNGPLACVLTDESQFFTSWQAEQLFFMVTVALNVPVICYGLQADFFSPAGFPVPPSAGACPQHRRDENHLPVRAQGNVQRPQGKWKIVFEGAQVAIDMEKTMCSTIAVSPVLFPRTGQVFCRKRRRRRHRNPAPDAVMQHISRVYKS